MKNKKKKKYSSGKKYFAGIGAALGGATGASAGVGAGASAVGGLRQAVGAAGSGGIKMPGMVKPSKFLGVGRDIAGLIATTTGDEKAGKVANILNNTASVSSTMEEQIESKANDALKVAKVAGGLPPMRKGINKKSKKKASKYKYMRGKM